MKIVDGKLVSPQEIILEEIKKHKMVVYQFSGGKDSQLALEYIEKILEKTNIRREACIVDTETELYGVFEHAEKVCMDNNIELKILKSQNTVEYFKKRGQFPHPFYKDCIHEIINKPINNYAKKKEAIVVAGHRKSQRVGKSKSDFIYKTGNKVTVLNPLYLFSEEEINKKQGQMLLWCGYKMGYQRTACWCCPFQTETHWETMKTFEPEKWKKMKALMEELGIVKLDDRPSGGILYKNAVPYWKKHNCKLTIIHKDGNKTFE